MADSEEEQGRVEELIDQGEREARSLEKDADELGEHIDDRRGEWARKRRDGDVPGAAPPDEDESQGNGAGAAEETPD